MNRGGLKPGLAPADCVKSFVNAASKRMPVPVLTTLPVINHEEFGSDEAGRPDTVNKAQIASAKRPGLFQ